MKIIRQLLFASAVALLSISLFVTFTQEAFLVPVSATILWWQTAAVPVIWFIAGSFLLGLSVGTVFAFTLWISAKKEIATQKKELLILNNTLEQPLTPELPSGKELDTQ